MTTATPMTMPKANSGIILFAHGSRDPQWRLPIEAVARRIEREQPGLAVTCAYLELCQPSLPDVLADWSTNGVTDISVVPMFLGAGRHAREDLPSITEALQLQYPAITIRLQTPIGEDARMTELMAQIAVSSALQPAQ